jgi:hypothetical protein
VRAESYALVCAAVPERLAVKPVPAGLEDLDAGLVAPAWSAFSRPIRQFLAAHVFGNWCAYNGRGLRTVVRSLDVALDVVRVEAARACAEAGRPSTSLGTTISQSPGRTLDQALLVEAFRATDLLLVHLADPTALADRMSAVEQG